VRSFTGALWTFHEPDPDAVRRLVDFSVSEALARCLVLRGVHDPTSARRFLSPSEADFHDPTTMLGMDVAVDRIQRAVRDRERVRIVTDYDVDGTTSSLILQATLNALGARETIDWHIPDRFTEGYGFSETAAARAIADGIHLLVTADVGVRDHAAVRRARDGGVDVIVCDHHLTEGGTVPDAALAVLCPPQEGCTYPNRSLAACGVSFKLAQCLLDGHPRRDDLLRSLLKLAAIGTVADVVNLGIQENRAIVSLGLAALSAGPNAPGLTALLQVCNCAGRAISTSDVGYRIGPRINAAGRIEHAREAVDLLLERDPHRARERAREIDRLNGERQQLQETLVQRILREVDGRKDLPLFPIFHGPEADGWHRGVVGIVAAKVRERLHRPVAVASVLGDTTTGSIRSIPEVHAVRALDAAADLLIRYGGHPAAAGFSISTGRIQELEGRLSAWVASQVDAEDMAPERDADLQLDPSAIGRELVRELERLEPLGAGNDAPHVAILGVLGTQFRTAKDKHLFFRVQGSDLGVVWWGGAHRRPDLEGHRVDLLGTLEADTRTGSPRLNLEDARPA